MSATQAGKVLYLTPVTSKPRQPSLFGEAAPQPEPQPAPEPRPERYQVKTTRQIKQELTERFGCKFSVTSGRGTARHWVDVRWIDGPAWSEVHDFTRRYNDDSRDDLMTDLWCGSQYTNVSRDCSYDAWLYAAKRVCQRWGLQLPEAKRVRSYDDRYDYAVCSSDPRVEAAGEWFSTLVHREFSEIDYRNVSVQLAMQGVDLELNPDDTITRHQIEPAAETVAPAAEPADLDLILESNSNLLACFA